MELLKVSVGTVRVGQDSFRSGFWWEEAGSLNLIVWEGLIQFFAGEGGISLTFCKSGKSPYNLAGSVKIHLEVGVIGQNPLISWHY